MEQDVTTEMASFSELLTTIAKLKEEEQWDQAIELVGKTLGALLGVKGPRELQKLTETGLLASLVSHTPMTTLWVPYKQIMLIALLKEAGDYATAKFPPRGGRGWYLKALHLLLDALSQGELDAYASLAPTMTELLAALGEPPFPEETLLRLAREHERKGGTAQTKEELQIILEHSFDRLSQNSGQMKQQAES